NIRLKGTVAAEEELADVRWAFGDADGRTLSSFNEPKKEVSFQQGIQLKPGANVVRIYAKAKSGGESSQKLTIHFRPELPRVEITQPARGRFVFDTGAAPKIEVRARVIRADEPRPFKVALLVNGKEQTKPEAPAAGA